MTEAEEAAGNISRKRNNKIKKTREARSEQDNEEIPGVPAVSPPREWPVQIRTGQELQERVLEFKWMENLIGSKCVEESRDRNT